MRSPYIGTPRSRDAGSENAFGMGIYYGGGKYMGGGFESFPFCQIRCLINIYFVRCAHGYESVFVHIISGTTHNKIIVFFVSFILNLIHLSFFFISSFLCLAAFHSNTSFNFSSSIIMSSINSHLSISPLPSAAFFLIILPTTTIIANTFLTPAVAALMV